MACTTFRSFRMLISSAVLAALAAPAGAAPIIFQADALRTNFAPNSLATIPEGDFVQLFAGIHGASTPDPISSLSVQATQGSLTVPLTFASTFDLYLRNGEAPYIAFIPFAGAPTGSWSITATDSTGTSLPLGTVPIFVPQLVPFVTAIRVSDTSTTPTVSWTLPDLTGFDVDQTLVAILDATTERYLFATYLPTATTSFAVPGGILTPGGSYLYSVGLEDQHSFAGPAENSSAAFSGVTRVPEPGILTLMLAALGLTLVRSTVRTRT